MNTISNCNLNLKLSFYAVPVAKCSGRKIFCPHFWTLPKKKKKKDGALLTVLVKNFTHSFWVTNLEFHCKFPYTHFICFTCSAH
jgi:hypothetical protein